MILLCRDAAAHRRRDLSGHVVDHPFIDRSPSQESSLVCAYDPLGRHADALRGLRRVRRIRPEATRFLDEAIRRRERRVGKDSS